MKLSKLQIEVIISSQSCKDNELRKKEEKEIKSNKKYLLRAKKYMNIIHQIPKSIRKEMYYVNNLTEQAFLTAITDKIPRKHKDANYCELKNKIIMTSIDCKDLEELKKTLGLLF